MPVSVDLEPKFKQEISVATGLGDPETTGVCYMTLKTVECLSKRGGDLNAKLATDLNVFAISPDGPCSAGARKRAEVTNGSARVTARPVAIGFKNRSSGGPRPGCDCGANDIVFSGPNFGGYYSVKAGVEFQFHYDGVRICVGQGFDKFKGTIA